MAEVREDSGPAPRRPSKERTIQPGPRCALLVWWVLIDVAVAAAAVLWGVRQLEGGARQVGWGLLGAALALLLMDAWRLAFLNRVRRLVSKGRIEQAQIASVRRTRFSLRPRADAPSPTGGWPIVRACEVRYVYDPGSGRRYRGSFVVALEEAQMFVPGEDVEVFVDRDDASQVVPSLVARWYFRVSSRMIGTAADDPEWDFTNPPPKARAEKRDRAG
jgi:hypothetical protein